VQNITRTQTDQPVRTIESWTDPQSIWFNHKCFHQALFQGKRGWLGGGRKTDVYRIFLSKPYSDLTY